MYWEEFWEHVVVASNLSAVELNREQKFHFMLHADKKSAGKWKDLPIPFPSKESEKVKDVSGISQLPPQLQSIVYRPDE
jgi:hypothetical protein